MNSIFLVSSNNNSIIGNNCTNNNSGYAIYLSACVNTTMTGNTILGHGIEIIGESIEKWNSHSIDATNVVNNRTVYYFRNKAGGLVPGGAGQIILANCSGMEISNQNISNTTSGISLVFCSSITVANNTVERSSKGIYLQASTGNLINNNTIRFNKKDGVQLLSSSNKNTIEQNWIEQNKLGLSISFSNDSSIIGNTFYQNHESGIHIHNSRRVSIHNSNFSDNGILMEGDNIEYWNTHTISPTNTIDGKPIYYYANATDILVPVGAGQVIISNCRKIIVADQDFEGSTVGLYVTYSTQIQIENNICSNGLIGIILQNSSNCSVVGNECNNNEYNGITLTFSPDTLISNNTCTDNNDHGMILSYSNNTTIVSNNCLNNEEYGLRIIYSNNVYIDDNICSYIENGVGILVENSHNNLLSNNTCKVKVLTSNVATSWNGEGISLKFSNNNSVISNLCDKNSINGIYLYYSSNNKLQSNICSLNRYGSGINTMESNNNSISDNVCKSNGHGSGIYLAKSDFNEVRSNQFNNNNYGVRLSQSFWNSIVNNDCSGNDWTGIRVGEYGEIRKCEFNLISQNTCTNINGDGIVLSGVRNNTVEMNICSSNHVGIELSKAQNNTIISNEISGNDRQGFQFFSSSNNLIENNTISLNDVGIFIGNGSLNNSIQNNGIFNNNHYGIEVANNRSLLANVALNWWGDPTGPYHPLNNPDGRGDNVSDFVEFSPWLEEWNPEDDEPGKLILYLLLTILIALFITLTIVIHGPDNYFQREQHGLDTGKKENERNHPEAVETSTPIQIIICEHCSGEFEISAKEISIRDTCPSCGRENVRSTFK